MSIRRVAIVFVFALAALRATAGPPGTDAFGDPLPVGAQARLGTVRWRVSAYIRAALLSPDGKTIILPGQRGILLVDARTGGSRAASTTALAQNPETVLVSRDGQTLVECIHDSFHVWDMPSGKKTIEFARPRGHMESAALADGGKYLVCFPRYINQQQGAAKATVWELASGKTVASVEPLQNQSITAALNPDGKLLATFGGHSMPPNAGNRAAENPASMVQIWDVATGKEKRRISTSNYQVQAARFSPDGKLLATSGYYGSIELWDVASGKLLRTFAARSGQGQKLYFSPDGKQFASTGRDGSIQVWETATGRRLGICETVCSPVLDIVFPASGPPIALGTRNQALLVWSVPDGRLLTPDVGHTSAPTALRFTRDAKSLLSFGVEGRVLEWNLAGGNQCNATEIRAAADRYDPTMRRRPYQSAEFSPSGLWLTLASDSGQQSLFEVKSGVELYAFSPSAPSYGRNPRLSFAANGVRVAGLSPARDNAGRNTSAVARIWDVENGQISASIPVPWINLQSGSSVPCALSADGSRLVIASQLNQNFTVVAFEVASGKELGRSTYQGYSTIAPVVSPDNRSVLIPAANGQAAIWDMVSGITVASVNLSKRTASGVACMASNGRFVALPIFEHQPQPNGATKTQYGVAIVEWASGEIRVEFKLPENVEMNSLAVSPDGKTLAAGCSDTSILLFDLAPAPDSKVEKVASDPAELWKRLAGGNAADAWRAMLELRAKPEFGLPILRKHIQPVSVDSKPDRAAVAKWIAQLDSPRFAEREEAERQLVRHAALVADEVREALNKQPSAEAKKRLTRIAATLDKPVRLGPPEARALELLEDWGTKEACEFLGELTAGDSAASLTREAKLALGRVASRRSNALFPKDRKSNRPLR